jgi:hypothetical protein
LGDQFAPLKLEEAMLQNLSYTTIWVHDQDEALAF